MNKNLIIVLAILGLILLSILCICNHRDNIETDLKTRSIAAISELEGFDGDIEVDGLDVTINGVVNSDELKLNIEQLIGSEEGVRNIFNNLIVELPKKLTAEVLQKIQEALNKVIEFENIEFQTNTAILLPKCESIIDQTAIILNENPEVSIEIGGHTDSTGDEDYNIALSQRRAETVLVQLVNKGISRDGLTAKGYGSSQSIADNSTLEGQQKNRRVEFIIKEEK